MDVVVVFCLMSLGVAGCESTNLSKRISGVYCEAIPKTVGTYWTLVLSEEGKFFAERLKTEIKTTHDVMLELGDGKYSGTWATDGKIVTLQTGSGETEQLAIRYSLLRLSLVPRRLDQSTFVWRDKFLIR